jgi:threonine/homoserine efflux transporter RhtA
MVGFTGGHQEKSLQGAKMVAGALSCSHILFFLKPVIAACLAVVFLNQSLTAWQVLAIIVICASVAVEACWGWLRGPRSN